MADAPRLTNETFDLDLDGLRQGIYTDKYFLNNIQILTALSENRTPLLGKHAMVKAVDFYPGEAEVEMQWFTRRPGTTLVAGIDAALEMLRLCSGVWENGIFNSTSHDLDVLARREGDKVTYSGSPKDITPVLRVRGRYRDYAHLETATLGVLTRASRVATNVYQALVAAAGKPILFFPARFDLYQTQAADGYAYQLAVREYNKDHNTNVAPFVSTTAQAAWWGGTAGGTIPHAGIACFLGDTVETSLAFAEHIPLQVPRIALVDFTNDNVRETLAVCRAFYEKFRRLIADGKTQEAERFRLFGVRLDTAGDMKDESLEPTGDPKMDLGVNPRLVEKVRDSLDHAWEAWDLDPKERPDSQAYCRAVKIIVSGGFNKEKIAWFESLHVPVDMYAVGSAMFDNHGETVTDFTADVVRVKIDGEWKDLAKEGRRAGDSQGMEKIKFSRSDPPGF